MTTLHPAPGAIINLVKCKCVKERCTTKRCQCGKANMKCTDLCCWSDKGKCCENMPKDYSGGNYEYDDDDYDEDACEPKYEYVIDSNGDDLS